MIGDDKSAISPKDRELLIPVADMGPADASSSSSGHHHHHHHPPNSGREACYKVIRSWASKKFMTGWSETQPEDSRIRLPSL